MTGLDRDGLTQLLAEQFPQAEAFHAVIDRVDPGSVTAHLDADERHLRPGGTVSGPTLMTLADTVSYFAVLSRIGPVALAVTTSVTIHFLRKAPPGRVVARGELLKLGRRLAVVQVFITGSGSEEPVAQATVTYALPPERG